MLINQKNCNILAFIGKPVEGLLDGWVFRFSVYDEKVLLGIWRLSYMLRLILSVLNVQPSMVLPYPNASQQKAGDGVLNKR